MSSIKRPEMEMKKCDICEEEHSEPTKSCRACHAIIDKGTYKNKYTTGEVRKALKNAYSCTKEGVPFFKCDYTGIESHFNITKDSIDPIDDAMILTLDHKNRGLNSNRGEVAVCLNIINQIKGEIPFNCFKDFITILAECLENKNDKNSKKVKDALDQMFIERAQLKLRELESRMMEDK